MDDASKREVLLDGDTHTEQIKEIAKVVELAVDLYRYVYSLLRQCEINELLCINDPIIIYLACAAQFPCQGQIIVQT